MTGSTRGCAVPGYRSVAVVIALIRPLHRDIDVLGLLFGQDGELGIEFFKLQPGHLLVEVFGQDVHAGWITFGMGEQLDICSACIS